MSELTQASLNLTPEERRAYGYLFKQADSDGLGVVPGDVAISFFEKTKLDSTVLGEIWQIGDAENRGFLTPAGFSAVLRLIGHCQAGRSADLDLAKQPGPLPKFDGITIPGQSSPLPPPPAGAGRVPSLAPEKMSEYSSLFEKAGAQDGLLAGDSAIQIFRNSRLSNEVMGQIWGLADRQERGSLSQTEFVVAMHLLASMRSGTMRAVPPTLPAGLWEAAARKPTPTQPTGVPRQFSGQAPQRTQSPLARQAVGATPLSPQSTGNDWLITPQDKTRFDAQFSNLDKEGRGYITGDQAVSYFSTSGLSEDALASIWDLADINSEGQLNRDEFAVAMYLIRQERSKVTGRGNLPTALPPRLIPPGMRKQTVAPSQPTAPTFDNAANAPVQPKSAADDLFGLDALSEAPQQSSQAQPKDPFAGDRPTSPSASSTASATPQPRLPPGPGTQFKPFQPTSTFGQGLASQHTGGSVASTQSSARGAGHDDLLGDTDPEVNKKFTSDTTELANMSNQVGTLRNQMQETQNKKATHERDLTGTNNQKRELETRLAQFRSQYEQEVREVRSLEERLTASRKDTRNLQNSLALLEGQQADLRSQHQQLSQAFEADQNENTQLKERTTQINAEIAQLKPALEKLKNDARQQKGMVAINKKQVSTSEGDRDRLKGEQSELEKSLSDSRARSPETSRDVPANVTSPATSVTSPGAPAGGSMNPFFRKTSSHDRTGSASSPRQDYSAASGGGHDAFESFFGPSVSTSKQTSTPPPTSFGGNSQRSVEEGSQGASTPLSALRTPPSETRAVSVETPGAVEPPAPPESRQITSSALPFRSSHMRTDSPSASVAVHPPASRSGFSDVAGVSTPGDSSAAASVNGDDTPSRSITQPATSELVQKPTAIRRQTSDQHIPGSFPGDVESDTRSTPTAGSTTSINDVSKSGLTSAAPHANRPPTDRDDFESAFANADLEDTSAAQHDPFGPASGQGKSRADTEFPPIQALDHDESDSSSEGGFEDSFGGAARTPQAQAPSLAPPAVTSLAADRPNLSSASSTTSALPTPNAQKPPPSYDFGQPEEHPDNVHLPKQYDGLLPQREAVNSSPEAAVQSPPASMSGFAASQRKGSLANHDTMPVNSELRNLAHEVPDKSGGRDEFDDAFDDLDEAEEAEDDAFGGQSSSQRKDDFDFGDQQFHSPTNTSRANTLSSSIQHTPTGSTNPTVISNLRTETESHPFGNSSNSPFGAATNSNASAQPGSGGLASSMSNQGHDWDAIFSSLDKPVSPSVTSNGPIIQGRSPFAKDEPSTAPTGAAPPQAPAVPSSATSSLQPPASERPGLARAISASSEHDDPILKTLTGMGYPREKALSALEKYDYNLDKAVDHLTFQK